MTNLSDLARQAARIAEASGNDYSKIDDDELSTMLCHLQYATLASSAFLTDRCGGEAERSRVQISRALELPANVLRRRSMEAERIVGLGGLPNIPQHAAHIAVLMNTVSAIEAMLEQRASGMPLQ